ncbi:MULTISPECIES: hypothetical protein [unclassified Coleofasciculus]|nr:MULTISPECIES: hypothetical protein [unclassified Coleofasciculus]MBE9128603.1 hypothetical protein [Coleofasciculus sp. LEGE 07081]MBE9150693.1 hypothetical protein [Coleofasciculus sp. LEGE 07092]
MNPQARRSLARAIAPRIAIALLGQFVNWDGENTLPLPTQQLAINN